MSISSLHQSQPHFNPSAPLFVTGRPRPVAYLRGHILTKGIRPEHILNKPRAICFDVTIIEQAEAAGATEIIVKCEEITYTTTLQHFRRYAFPVNRLAGHQWGMELVRWSVNGATPELDAREQVQAARDSQLDLFGGAA